MWFEAEVARRNFKFSALGLFAVNYELLFAVIFNYEQKLRSITKFNSNIFSQTAGSFATNMAILVQAQVLALEQQ